MSEERTPFLCAGAGFKGTGKTVETEKAMQEYVSAKGANMPVIIFDVNGEFEHYQTLKWDITQTKLIGKHEVPDDSAIVRHLIGWSERCRKGDIPPSIKRIVPFHPNGEEMSQEDKERTATLLLKKFKNGAVWLEDYNNYLLGAKSVDIIGAITTNRHRNQDVILHVQSINAIFTRIMQNLNYLRIHHTTDKKLDIDKKCPNPEVVHIARCIVDSHVKGKHGLEPNRYFCVGVMPDVSKLDLHGDEGNNLFRIGAMEYLKANKSVRKKYSDMIKEAEKYTPDIEDITDKFVKENAHYMA